MDLLCDKTACWDNIGRELGVKLNDRDSIRNDSILDNSERLEWVLNKWLESESPSWDQFITAMKKLEYHDIVQSITALIVSTKREMNPSKIFRLLSEKTARWDDIGRELGVKVDYRNSLDQERSLGNSGRLERVLEKWLESDPNPLWEQFIAAMKKLEYNDVVQTIMEEQCKLVSPAEEQKV